MHRWLVVAALALVACKRAPARPPVTITDLEPTSGDPSGGKVVQIVGTNFDPHSTVEVKFGDKVARAIVVAKDRIQLESPPGKAGEEVEVTVRFPDGRGGTAPQKYRWEPQDPDDAPPPAAGAGSGSSGTAGSAPAAAGSSATAAASPGAP